MKGKAFGYTTYTAAYTNETPLNTGDLRKV